MKHPVFFKLQFFMLRILAPHKSRTFPSSSNWAFHRWAKSRYTHMLQNIFLLNQLAHDIRFWNGNECKNQEKGIYYRMKLKIPRNFTFTYNRSFSLFNMFLFVKSSLNNSLHNFSILKSLYLQRKKLGVGTMIILRSWFRHNFAWLVSNVRYT